MASEYRFPRAGILASRTTEIRGLTGWGKDPALGIGEGISAFSICSTGCYRGGMCLSGR